MQLVQNSDSANFKCYKIPILQKLQSATFKFKNTNFALWIFYPIQIFKYYTMQNLISTKFKYCRI